MKKGIIPFAVGVVIGLILTDLGLTLTDWKFYLYTVILGFLIWVVPRYHYKLNSKDG